MSSFGTVRQFGAKIELLDNRSGKSCLSGVPQPVSPGISHCRGSFGTKKHFRSQVECATSWRAVPVNSYSLWCLIFLFPVRLWKKNVVNGVAFTYGSRQMHRFRCAGVNCFYP